MFRITTFLTAAACSLAYLINITASDGVNLSTDVDIPPDVNASAPGPVVLDRSPYGHFAIELIADIMTLQGYVALRQDVRGTGLSGGHFGLWADSQPDGYTTAAWAVSQPWASGEVCHTGASADGLAALAEMSAPHPATSKEWLIFAGTTAHEMIFPGGALRYNLAHSWLSNTVRPGDFDDCWAQVLANEAPGSWWDRLNGTKYYRNVFWPTTQWAGWYDIFLVGQLIGFHQFQDLSPSAGKHRLVIDPLGHCQDGWSYFPKNVILGRVLLPILLALDMFGVAPPAEGVKALTFYVMGANNDSAPGDYWTTLDTWPTPSVTPLYFSGTGLLSWMAPPAQRSLTYVYDPSNPVPTIGGNNLFGSCGPKDQSPLEGRADVLDFTSLPLPAPLAVTGPLTATLYVSTNCTDTDFTLRLTDVYPTGESILIQDGIVRLRWRDVASNPVPQPVVPGVVYEVQVSLWNTSYIFDVGHRIRVDVSSSNYPRFASNPNNGLPLNATGPVYAANNSLWYGGAYPSAVFLPVVNYTSQLPETHVTETYAAELDHLTQVYRDAFAAKGFYDDYAESHASHRILRRAARVRAEGFEDTRAWIEAQLGAFTDAVSRRHLQ